MSKRLNISVKEYTDKEIIECLRNRQSYVVRYLHDRYFPMIRLMVKQYGGSREDALDLFQDGLMILIEKIDNKDFALTCKLMTYLYCVCENLWRSIQDKRNAAEIYLSKQNIDIEEDFSEELDNELYESILRDSFNSLDESGKNILKLYFQDLTLYEIADKLGFTYGYVRKKKSETQAELIKKVKSHPDYKRIVKHETLTYTGAIFSPDISQSE